MNIQPFGADPRAYPRAVTWRRWGARTLAGWFRAAILLANSTWGHIIANARRVSQLAEVATSLSAHANHQGEQLERALTCGPRALVAVGRHSADLQSNVAEVAPEART